MKINNYLYVVYFFVVAILLLLTHNLLGQIGYEGECLPIYNFNSKEYRAEAQNFSVVQNKLGIMYFGNNSGNVLEYDGINWRKLEVGNTPVRALATDSTGTIYVGTENDYGYFRPDSSYGLKFHSIDTDKSASPYIYKIVCCNGIVYYQSDSCIYAWDGHEVNKKKTSKIIFFGELNDSTIIYTEKEGIRNYNTKSGKIICDPDGTPTSINLKSIFSLNNDTLLLATRNNGLFYGIKNAKCILLKKFKTEIDSFLIKNKIISAIRSLDRIIIGTKKEGTVIISKNGKLLQYINEYSCLQNNNIESQFIDSNGNLWLALDKGISKIEINSNITYFRTKSGFEGSVQTIVKYRNNLYIGTNKGLFYINTKERKINKVINFKGAAWDMIVFTNEKDSLFLIAGDKNVFQYYNGKGFSQITDKAPWKLYYSNDQKSIYVGTDIKDTGLQCVKYDNYKWKIEDILIEQKIRYISSKKGILWLSLKDNNGLLKYNISTTQYDTCNASDGLPDGFCFVYFFNDSDSVVCTTEGFYKLNQYKNKFEKDKRWANLPIYDRCINRVYQDNNKLWISTDVKKDARTEIGYITLDKNNYNWIYQPFKSYIETNINAFFTDVDNVTWLGGDEGLFRYSQNYKDTSIIYTFIRKVTVGFDSTIYNGAILDSNKMITFLKQYPYKIDYALNSFVFEFASLSRGNDKKTLFSYKLNGFKQDGVERTWSDWTKESKAYYTNLAEGEYTFMVKAKDAFDKESKISSFTFTIKPPWYRTWLAYILFVIVAIVLVIITIKLYTRRIAKQKEKLEQIVLERTEEINATNEVLKEKEKSILDSITYAKEMQRALLPSENTLKNYFKDYFLIYKPRDIVSGDFYWVTNSEHYHVFCVADCAGHGVPGAFLSILGISLLKEIVESKKIVKADEILNWLRFNIMEIFKGSVTNKESIDISLCVFDRTNRKLHFAGANNSIFVKTQKNRLNDELLNNSDIEYLDDLNKNVDTSIALIKLNADRMPVGNNFENRNFTSKSFLLEKDDIIYLMSDGFQDQFGGPKGKKFKVSPLKRLLFSIAHLSMEEQKKSIERILNDWQGKLEQCDDITILGIRIP